MKRFLTVTKNHLIWRFVDAKIDGHKFFGIYTKPTRELKVVKEK